MPGNLRDYRRYQRFPVYPVRAGGAAGGRRGRARPAPGPVRTTRLGRWIVRLLGGGGEPGKPAGGRATGSMDG